MNERTYIVFEATPGFFSANLNNSEFQKALFGGIIDNSKRNTFTIEDGIKEVVEWYKNNVSNLRMENKKNEL